MRIKSLKYLSITFTFKRKRFTNNFKNFINFMLFVVNHFLCVCYLCVMKTLWTLNEPWTIDYYRNL